MDIQIVERVSRQGVKYGVKVTRPVKYLRRRWFRDVEEPGKDQEEWACYDENAFPKLHWSRAQAEWFFTENEAIELAGLLRDQIDKVVVYDRRRWGDY